MPPSFSPKPELLPELLSQIFINARFPPDIICFTPSSSLRKCLAFLLLCYFFSLLQWGSQPSFLSSSVSSFSTQFPRHFEFPLFFPNSTFFSALAAPFYPHVSFTYLCFCTKGDLFDVPLPPSSPAALRNRDLRCIFSIWHLTFFFLILRPPESTFLQYSFFFFAVTWVGPPTERTIDVTLLLFLSRRCPPPRFFSIFAHSRFILFSLPISFPCSLPPPPPF